jgi:TctA family transporter
MEVDMLGSALHALGILFDPARLGFLLVGVLLGLVIAIIPGIGGIAGLSIMLPFTFSMDPYSALAMMMGLASVIATGDLIPAILFGVPGGVGSAATVLDGYPLARQGQAGRALGAGFSASVLGGLFGALLLGLSIPILRPVVLNVGSPELLAFCIFGLSLVGVLSGSSPAKGLAAGCVGILLSMIGDDPQTGTLRWTFDTLYLWDGVPIAPIALAMFAIPELADIAIGRTAIAGKSHTATALSQWEGTKDVFRHWWLMLRCSSIGSVLGSMPGIGASVIDWIAYGHAARSEKGARETFGKGDVRGVIASESSNNSREGGALVPTIAFGVPGTASMAILLGAFLIHGIVPGPDMLTKRLDVTYVLVWSVALANVFGAGICYLFANQLAKIALLRYGVLLPTVLAVTFVGAYAGSASWGDIYLMVGLGALAWVMKRLGWPRPPVILGFVLGNLMERYMFISVERYDWAWLGRPVVIAFLALALYGILSPMIRDYLKDRKAGGRVRRTLQAPKLSTSAIFGIAVAVVFAAALVSSRNWEFGARLFPQTASYVGLLCAAVFVLGTVFLTPRMARVPAGGGGAGPGAAHDLRQEREVVMDLASEFEGLSRGEVTRRFLVYLGWLVFFTALGHVIGLMPAMLVFLVAYMRYGGDESWRLALAVSLPLWIMWYFLFDRLIRLAWPQSLIGDWFPALRSFSTLF